MSLRTRVLGAFRKLHRTRMKVFYGDEFALDAGRQKINGQFKQNKGETEIPKIEELVQIAEDSEMLLRTTVVQAREKADGQFEVKVTPDTQLGSNKLFDPLEEIPTPRRRTGTRKCSDASEKS